MGEAEDTPGVIAPPPLTALAALLLGFGFDWALLVPSRICGAFGSAGRISGALH